MYPTDMNEQVLFTIHDHGWDGECIVVEVDTGTPYHKWWDGGNMWGNHSMQITWQDVEQMNAERFRGINETNWRDYLK